MDRITVRIAAVAAVVSLVSIAAVYAAHRSDLAGKVDKLVVKKVPLPRLKPESRLKEKRWVRMHHQDVAETRRRPVELMFLGDSITQGWNRNPTWRKYYGHRNALNAGIWSDRVQHVLWRVQNGLFDYARPKTVVLMVGVNNIKLNTSREIAGGVRQIIRHIHARSPESRILLMGIFPAGRLKSDPRRAKISKTNQVLHSLADDHRVEFLDIGRKFLTQEGTFPKRLSSDYLHLRRRGYRIWAKAMEPKLRYMISAGTHH